MRAREVKLLPEQDSELRVFHEAYLTALAGLDFAVIEGPRAAMAEAAYADVSRNVKKLGFKPPSGQVITGRLAETNKTPKLEARPPRRLSTAMAVGLTLLGTVGAYSAGRAVHGLLVSASPTLDCSNSGSGNQLYESRFPAAGGEIVVSTPDGPIEVADHMGKLALLGGHPAFAARRFSLGQWVGSFVSASGQYDIYDGLADINGHNGEVTWSSQDAATIACDGILPGPGAGIEVQGSTQNSNAGIVSTSIDN